jgi:hypothetical protein
MDIISDDDLSRRVIGLAIGVHRQLGPGLAESMDETGPCDALAEAAPAHCPRTTIADPLQKSDPRWPLSTGCHRRGNVDARNQSEPPESPDPAGAIDDLYQPALTPTLRAITTSSVI